MGSTLEGPICSFHCPILRPQRSHRGQSGPAAPIKEQSWADYRARWRWWHKPPVVGRLSVVSEWTARTVTERAWKRSRKRWWHMNFWQDKMADRTFEIICFHIAAPSCNALQWQTKLLPKPTGRMMKTPPNKIEWFPNNVTSQKGFPLVHHCAILQNLVTGQYQVNTGPLLKLMSMSQWLSHTKGCEICPPHLNHLLREPPKWYPAFLPLDHWAGIAGSTADNQAILTIFNSIIYHQIDTFEQIFMILMFLWYFFISCVLLIN